MAALLIIVLSLVLIGVLSALFAGLPRSLHKVRQNTRNAERQALAASQGWYSSPYAPELVSRWYAAPFVQRGDRRLVYGVVSGTYNGVRFTVFDFQLRTHISVVNGVQSEDNSVYTVWVIHLPTTLPHLTVVRRGIFGRRYSGEVPWLDPGQPPVRGLLPESWLRRGTAHPYRHVDDRLARSGRRHRARR